MWGPVCPLTGVEAGTGVEWSLLLDFFYMCSELQDAQSAWLGWRACDGGGQGVLEWEAMLRAPAAQLLLGLNFVFPPSLSMRVGQVSFLLWASGPLSTK